MLQLNIPISSTEKGGEISEVHTNINSLNCTRKNFIFNEYI